MRGGPDERRLRDLEAARHKHGTTLTRVDEKILAIEDAAKYRRGAMLWAAGLMISVILTGIGGLVVGASRLTRIETLIETIGRSVEESSRVTSERVDAMTRQTMAFEGRLIRLEVKLEALDAQIESLSRRRGDGARPAPHP